MASSLASTLGPSSQPAHASTKGVPGCSLTAQTFPTPGGFLLNPSFRRLLSSGCRRTGGPDPTASQPKVLKENLLYRMEQTGGAVPLLSLPGSHHTHIPAIPTTGTSFVFRVASSITNRFQTSRRASCSQSIPCLNPCRHVPWVRANRRVERPGPDLQGQPDERIVIPPTHPYLEL